MKTKLIFFIISIAIFFAGCKNDQVVLPDALIKAKTNLTEQFSILDQKMATAVTYMNSINMDTTLIRVKLLELANEFPYVVNFSEITPLGIMQIKEPATYHSLEGTDISKQAHVIKSFETKLPVMSNQFLSVEDKFATVIMHPIFKDSTIAGGLTALLYPEMVLGNIMKPLLDSQEFEMLVMEKGGRILYNQDTTEIGLNLFTDSLYMDFPELIAVGKQIDSLESGTAYYSFLKTGTKETVKKLTFWTTYELYGTQWKLIWSKPE